MPSCHLHTQDNLAILSNDEIQSLVEKSLAQRRYKKVLVIHPDYSRHDFCAVLFPALYKALLTRGLERIDTLNASGTHRAMSHDEIADKLGIPHHGVEKLGELYNHSFDNPANLKHVIDLPAEFVSAKTSGHLSVPLSVNVNRLLYNNYDLIVAISGTIPHEALGYSGGTKIFFPGCSGPEVIGLLHWAAVLIGIPQIIGHLDNPARDIVNEGTRHIIESLGHTQVMSLNMVYTEDDSHRVVPRGLFTGTGFSGFGQALRAAAELSSQLHIRYLEKPQNVIVQQLPAMYDEVWTAGKGSYKLQKEGVLAPNAEIILYAPHIHCFHSNKTMDDAIRQIGYHGRDYVVDYCKRHPQFDKNIASHVINVRGLGMFTNGKEEFPFKVTLATQIPEKDCLAVNLEYRDPKTLRAEDFSAPGRLWIHDGGQWLYAKKSR